jgi:hypothetical protein
MTEAALALAPSTSGSVLLDIGGDVGALSVLMPAARLGWEIEISPAGRPEHRTHTAVRERRLGSRTQFSAVFPALSAGVYTLWLDATTSADDVVVISGGSVTRLDWSAS